MGRVCLAEDTQLDNKQFAIKMLPSFLVANKRAYRQLKDEALVAMKLTHPNIVTLRAFEENDGKPFLEMDYVDGQTLDDYLAEHTGTTGVPPVETGLPESDVLRILRPIAAALDYAQGEGVVHRDVKPENVMIRKDGHPFVLDFGIAREIRETLTRITGKLSSGTLLYMSPEQLIGEQPRPAQDVYSFAAMAYECLKGKPPFSHGQIEFQIMNKQPEPPPGGTQLVASVMAGLEKKPEDRPSTCVAVLEGKYVHVERVDGNSGSVGAPRPPVGTYVPGDRVDVPPQEARDAAAYTQADCVRLMADAKVVQRHIARYSEDSDFRNEFQEIADDFVRANAIFAEKQWALAAECYVRIVRRGKTLEEALARRADAHDKVQLWAGGPYWATTNIGAEKPEDYGYYFWWGDTVGYKREGDSWVASDGSARTFSFNEANTPTYKKDFATLQREGWISPTNVLAMAHDAAHVHWGGTWRMPTERELDDLVNKCDWDWTTVNGVKGYVVRGRGNYASQSIFLPCAGHGPTSLVPAGSDGYYWSSLPNSDDYRSRGLYFFSSYHRTGRYYRGYGLSVRPIQGFTK